MKTIENAEIKEKTVLVRVDYNVPLKNGEVEDDLRIRASLPTLNYLREEGAKKIILISHLGRPKGEKVAELSLAPVAKKLAELIPNVSFLPEISGEKVEEKVATMQNGEILLLENLRFYPGEEANSSDFIGQIIKSTGAELFVQDGFAVVHRAHASTDAVTKILPSYAGLLVKTEVEGLTKAIENPEKPVVLIIGGAKVEDKSPLIGKFQNLADEILVGGKIAADGFSTEDFPEAKTKLYIAHDFDEDATGAKLDVGPFSTADMVEIIKNSKTVIWNGLLGKAEDPAFATSSTIIAEALGENENIFSVICGGDTTAFVEQMQKDHPNLEYGLVSTGGGAALEFFLKGEDLPGLKVLA